MIPLRTAFDGAELALPRPHTAAPGAIPGYARAKDLRPKGLRLALACCWWAVDDEKLARRGAQRRPVRRRVRAQRSACPKSSRESNHLPVSTAVTASRQGEV